MQETRAMDAQAPLNLVYSLIQQLPNDLFSKCHLPLNSDRSSHLGKPKKLDCPLYILWGYSSSDVCFSSVFFTFIENSADLDEMPHVVAFHQGFHCFPKYPFMGNSYIKG